VWFGFLEYIHESGEKKGRKGEQWWLSGAVVAQGAVVALGAVVAREQWWLIGSDTRL
jgi:hypothetical protein